MHIEVPAWWLVDGEDGLVIFRHHDGRGYDNFKFLTYDLPDSQWTKGSWIQGRFRCQWRRIQKTRLIPDLFAILIIGDCGPLPVKDKNDLTAVKFSTSLKPNFSYSEDGTELSLEE
jgi:hypothetical protein